MKQLILTLAVIALYSLGLRPAAADRFGTLAGVNSSITIGPGETALLVYLNETVLLDYNASGRDSVRFTVAGSSLDVFSALPLVGPATITLRSSTAVVGLRVVPTTYSGNAMVATSVPANAVVIPANATGPVEVMLESSVDMVTWTAATPGTYGSGTDARFFRVRARLNN